MLRFLFLVAIATAFCAATESIADENAVEGGPVPFILENEIIERIKNLSILLRPYDPYVIRKSSYKYSSPNIRGEIEAKDILLRGFSKFYATNMRNTITVFPPGVKSTFNVKFEELHFIVPYYYFDGLAVFVPFYGKGAVNLVARDINGGANAVIRTGLSGLSLKKLELRLNISSTDLFVTGLLHNEPLSKIVSVSTTECFSEFVNTYNDRLGKLLGERLIEPINNVLHPPKKPKPEGLGSENGDEDDDDDDLEEDDENDDGSSSESTEGEEIKIGPHTFNIKFEV